MSVKLKLQPFSATLSQAKSIGFLLSGFDKTKKYKIVFENATNNRPITVLASNHGNLVDKNLYVNDRTEVEGKIDLNIGEHESYSVVSIYANIYERLDSEFALSDIAAFAFQIESNITQKSNDKITVFPPFVQKTDKATIKIKTDPNSKLQVSVNNKRFVIHTNYEGVGSMSFRAIDILSGEISESSALQKFPITYHKAIDNYSEQYDSGVFLHYVPDGMKALQATNDPEVPACAILDAAPTEGLVLNKIDDYCVNAAVVGDMSIFDSESNFYNSKVGYCSELSEVYPKTTTNTQPCRIYNSTSITELSSGINLAVFSSQINSQTNPNPAGRVFVSKLPNTFKYQGSSVRDGTIIKPFDYIHVLTPSAVAIGQKYTLTFRITDGLVFDIEYQSLLGSARDVVSSFVGLINADARILENKIKAIDQGTFFEVKSNTRFTVRTKVTGTGVFGAQLRAGTTLELLTDAAGIQDAGNTVVFLTPKVGYQSHDIVTRDVENNIIYIKMPDGYNNDKGPVINDNYYCEKFIVVNTSALAAADAATVNNPLPPIYDIYNREVSCVYPVVASYRKNNLSNNPVDFVYVVCQAPVNGIYQLFFYSFIYGQSVINTSWKQLTELGENKNAKIKCDKSGNLHLIWESDRTGATQLYYSCLGSVAKNANNKTYVSLLEKNVIAGNPLDLATITEPAYGIQNNWVRLLDKNGKVSIFDKTYIAIQGAASEDVAMAYYKLSKDEFGNDFTENFNQLSYQLSFDLRMSWPTSVVYDDATIEAQYEIWKSAFTPVGDYKYEKNNNYYTIDGYTPYYNNFIPICGSFKLGTTNIQTFAGGSSVDGISHNTTNIYGKFNEAPSLTNPANLRHFMLGLVPEKMRFKAKNTETFAQYCERNNFSFSTCVGYNNEIDYVLSTGRYKLALLLSTSDNRSSGKLAEKKYIIHRLIDGYFDFTAAKNIKIAVHYSKMSSDYISQVLSKDKNAVADEIRYQADIMLTLENEIICAQNFVADFSDQYRQFDILLGLPYGQGFEINESVPYRGNNYEAGSIRQIFTNIAVSPHTITHNTEYITLSDFDRNVRQMVVPDVVDNELANSSFEETQIPFATETAIEHLSTVVTGWTVNHGCILRRSASRYGTNGVVVSTENASYRPSEGSSWVELTGNIGTVTSNYGSIEQNISTTIGKKYYVYFDVSAHPNTYTQGLSVTKKIMIFADSNSRIFNITTEATQPTQMSWKTYTFQFTATSTSTNIKFMNVSNQFGTSKDLILGPQLDNIKIISEDNLNDELSSYSTNTSLGIDEFEFNSNFSLNAQLLFTQIPITLSSTRQSTNADFVIDDANKLHLTYQSNRNNYWDVYYASTRYVDDPFKFDTKITDAQSNSINPSIAIDSKGRRLIAWQDNRAGNFQIYSAICKTEDDTLPDRCKQDEVDAFIYSYNNSLDIYDPYAFQTSQLSCDLKFIFTPQTTEDYHFVINFYEDKNYTILYKKISSKLNIDAWKVDGTPLRYNGLTATANSNYEISYTPSAEDNVTGRVYYVTVEYEISTNFIDVAASSNIEILQAYEGLDLRSSRLENDTKFRVILESDEKSPRKIPTQTPLQLNVGKINSVYFDSPLLQLPGVSVGQKVQSVLVHYDAVGATGNSSCVIKFEKPILALILSGYDLSITNAVYGNSGIIYGNQAGTGIETNDYIKISDDRKTLTYFSQVNPAVDQIRILLESTSSVSGENKLVYYCPSKQLSRCDVNCRYINNETTDQVVHFRVTFYGNPEKTDVILSTFTQFDNLNWLIGNSEQFPTTGLTVKANESINVVYAPDILPFELYNSQSATSYANNNILRQPLLCGVTYTCVVETYRNNQFFVESEFEFICACSQIESDRWGYNHDDSQWISSAHGFADYQITATDNQCLYPKINCTVDDKFYITWQDYRYARILEDQQAVSPDYYVAIYDANQDVFYSSGQGKYDRSLLSYSQTGKNIFDVSVFIDPYQNINLVGHDGNKLFWQACSFGCLYRQQVNMKSACMFTDDTSNSLFDIGGAPDRIVEQYQKIRVMPKYVAYSTYLDTQTPIAVINDCFVELDIIGVPGTYAYRLRNEDDSEWSAWLPIGPDLPEQPLLENQQTNNPAQNQLIMDQITAEQKFFRAYFIGKDRFVAPWITSKNNGMKKICCEILTFFGKTELFCIDFMASYQEFAYKIDLFFDQNFTQPLPAYKNIRVASTSKTETLISESNLISIGEDRQAISQIYVRIEFKDKQKTTILERLQGLEKYGKQTITMNVYQQGLNDQLSLPVFKVSDGVYRSSFKVFTQDGIFNRDGLGLIMIDIPNLCKQMTLKDYVNYADSISNNQIFASNVSINNNLTPFRDLYQGDDIKASFGNFEYYKKSNFGSSSSSPWVGGSDGSLGNNLGYDGAGGGGTPITESNDGVVPPRSLGLPYCTELSDGSIQCTDDSGAFSDVFGDNKLQNPRSPTNPVGGN